MKFSLAAGALLGGLAAAHPLSMVERQANIDVTILQFALTLEHLENVFYKQALKNFTQQDFMDAGYSADYYNNLMYIAFDEESHVKLLTSAISAAGYSPVAACTYKFPYTDVRSFITLSSVLEGVGTSAYLAGAPLITSKTYLTVAGSILVTEALHTSMQRGAIGEIPMANPYGTPLDPTSVYTLAAMFIVSCPASNPSLGFTAFPTLTYDTTGCTCEEPDCTPSQAVKRSKDWGPWESTTTESAWSGPTSAPPAATNTVWATKTMTETEAYPSHSSSPSYNYCAPPSAGSTIKFTAAKPIPAGSYVTFISGLSVVSVKGTISGSDVTVVIPSIALGQTYVLITNADIEGALVDSAVLFGPAVVEVKPPPPSINYSILK